MKNSTPHVRKEFWDTQKRFLKIGSSGKIYYTEDGKKEYRSLFSRHGFAIENVTTLSEFRRTLNTITAMQLEENDAELLRALNDPKLTDAERATLADILKLPLTPHAALAPQSSAVVVQMSNWKSKNSI